MFEFQPLLLFINARTSHNDTFDYVGNIVYVLVYQVRKNWIQTNSSPFYLTISWNENTVNWWIAEQDENSPHNQIMQKNKNNYTYDYVVVG